MLYLPPLANRKTSFNSQGTSRHRDPTLNSQPRKNRSACTSLENSRGPSAVSLELLASLRNLSTPTAGLLGSRSLPTWIELSSLQSSHTCSYDYLMIHDTKVVIALSGYKWGSLGSKEVRWPEMRLQETLSVCVLSYSQHHLCFSCRKLQLSTWGPWQVGLNQKTRFGREICQLPCPLVGTVPRYLPETPEGLRPWCQWW